MYIRDVLTLYFLIPLVSFALVFLITPSVRYVALKLSVVDKINHRKIHRKVVTNLGGIGIYFGLLGGLSTIYIFHADFFAPYAFHTSSLIICSSLVLALGVYDDVQGSNAYSKFFIQTIASILLIKAGFILKKICILGFIDINLGCLSVPITILWLVGITNAINLIDGLDGLATGMLAIMFLCFFFYGIIFKEIFISFISLALVGACVAFLKYNFYPAKIFLGDTGSLFLGFIVGSLAIYSSGLKGITNPFFFPAVVVLLLPIADTICAIIRRILRRQPIFKGDACHVHHYCIKIGLSHPETVKRLCLITVALGVVSIVVAYIYGYPCSNWLK